MERRPDSGEDRAVVEATEWLMRLQDHSEDEALRRRFEAWRAASTANDAAWADLVHLSNVAAVMRPTYAGQWRPFVARRRAERAMARPQSLRAVWRPRRWALPALMAVAACLVLLAAPPLLLRLQADHVTSTAEQRRIDLPDGSRVTLAPASAIAVSYEAAERRVQLLSGEAFFQVQPNADRPFKVAARTVQATVLGTSFDVRLERDDVAVSVEEGAVRVSRAGSSESGERLEAGQSVRVSSDGRLSHASEAPQLVAAWRRGQLYAQDRRLGDAVDQLRRYFPGSIVVTDDALADQRITGAYNLADPEHALRGIAKAHGATVRRITPWLLIVSGS